MASNLKAKAAGLSKNKLLTGTVTEVLGDKLSVQLAGNGRKLIGIPYVGGPISVGKKVFINYGSGQPIAEAIGEATTIPTITIPKTPAPVQSDHEQVVGHTHVEADITNLDHNAVKLQGYDISNSAPSEGNVLVWNANNSEWMPAEIEADGGGHIIENEEVTMAQRSILSFQGDGVTVIDDSINDRTIVNIPGAVGGGTGGPAEGVVAYGKSITQSWVGDDEQEVSFDTEIYDTGNCGYPFTAPHSGYYYAEVNLIVTLRQGWQESGEPIRSWADLYFYKNGATWVGYAEAIRDDGDFGKTGDYGDGGATYGLHGSCVVYLTEGDTLSVNLWMDCVGSTFAQGVFSPDPETNHFMVIPLDQLGGAVEGGTGDMLKEVYDLDDDGIVDHAELADSVPWDGVTDKPTTFPPNAHNHDDRYFTETELGASGQAAVHWDNITNEPASFPPAAHTHTEADITDLEHNAEWLQDVPVSTDTPNNLDILQFKANQGSGIWEPTALPSEYPPSAHTHVEAEITDLDHDAEKLQGRALANTAPDDGDAIVWDQTNSIWKPAAVGGTGNGDMLKTTYDQDNDGVVDAAESAPWDGITDKPTSFPPEIHGHRLVDLLDVNAADIQDGDMLHYDGTVPGGIWNCMPEPSFPRSLNDLSDVEIDGPMPGASILAMNDEGLWIAEDQSLLRCIDFPDSYEGQAGKLLAVKQTFGGIEFIDPPSGSGDMTKAVYDTDNDNIVEHADLADTVPWTGITDKPTLFPPDAHNHDNRYYTKPNLQTSGQAQVHWDNLTNRPATYPSEAHAHTVVDEKIWYFDGNLQTGASTLHVTNFSGVTRTITKVGLRVHGAPGGAAIIVDVHKNGNTIFTTQTNRPQIPDGQVSGYIGTINVSSWADGEDLTVEIDQVGSGTPGAALSVFVIYTTEA